MPSATAPAPCPNFATASSPSSAIEKLATENTENGQAATTTTRQAQRKSKVNGRLDRTRLENFTVGVAGLPSKVSEAILQAV